MLTRRYTRVDEVIWLKTNQLQRVIRTGRTGHWLKYAIHFYGRISSLTLYSHTKEHMLVGVKTVSDESGNLKFPAWANRGLDTDVIVSEVRETSRKPEEVYGLIERMCPGGRKIGTWLMSSFLFALSVLFIDHILEIFGRKHNTRPGSVSPKFLCSSQSTHLPDRWLTLGNQLGNADQIYEEDLAARVAAR